MKKRTVISVVVLLVCVCLLFGCGTNPNYSENAESSSQCEDEENEAAYGEYCINTDLTWSVDRETAHEGDSENAGATWYVKKEIETTYSEACVSVIIKEYDSNGNLLCEKRESCYNGKNDYHIYKYYYDEENMISHFSYIDSYDNDFDVAFEKRLSDGKCIYTGYNDGEEYVYTYSNGHLESTTHHEEYGMIIRDYEFDEFGNVISEAGFRWVYKYEYEDGKMVKRTFTVSNNVHEVLCYKYDERGIIEELRTDEDGCQNVTEYSYEKVDKNTTLVSLSNGSYEMVTVDDYGNLIQRACYKKDGTLRCQEEKVWAKA